MTALMLGVLVGGDVIGGVVGGGIVGGGGMLVGGGIVGGGGMLVGGGMVGGGDVGGGDVGGGMVGGGGMVKDGGGIVGGGGILGKLGKDGRVNVGKSGGETCAPADDSVNARVPEPTASNTAKRRFQTCMPNLRFRSTNASANVAPTPAGFSTGRSPAPVSYHWI